MRNRIVFILLVLPSFCFANSKDASINDDVKSCESVLTDGVSAEQRFAIAVARSTDEVSQILAGESQIDPDTWIVVDLVQDQSHLGKAPPIPSFALTLIAKKAFYKKIPTLVGESRPVGDLPKLTKMYFLKQPEDFREASVSLTAHTYIKLKAKDLPAVADWFVKTMYHPALGNKVFKISLRP